MAVTVRTYDISANWGPDTILDVLQTALADVGYHAAAQTGTILTFTNTSGTTIPSAAFKRYLVTQSATSGSGQYCTFDVLRSNTGAVSAVTLVNGGQNYAGTNTITIAGADIGGTTPTDNITVTVSTVSGSQGTTSTWYDKDTATPYTWGVCCVNNDITKKMGQTYYSFHIPSFTAPTQLITLYVRSGAGFQSTTNVFNGVSGLDYFSTNVPNSTTQQGFSQVIAKSNTSPLRLTTYQSGIDPSFVVFQFSDTVKYGDLYRYPFFLSKYNTATQPWSLDDCFTGGIYEISKSQVSSTVDANITTQVATAVMGKRQGEWGYGNLQGTYANFRGLIGYYESIHGKRYNTGANQLYPGIYQRTTIDLTQTSLEYNPVITGIPICNVMVPVPYYIPADFGVTEIIGTNTISYTDLVSVGATTKWKVLQYANNLTLATYNSSIAFVAKTVD